MESITSEQWANFSQVAWVAFVQVLVPFIVSIIKQEHWTKVQKFWLAVFISVLGGILSQSLAMLTSGAQITPASMTTAAFAVFIASQANYKAWFTDLKLDDLFNPKSTNASTSDYAAPATNEYATDEKINQMLASFQQASDSLYLISHSLAAQKMPVAPAPEVAPMQDIGNDKKSAYVADDIAHEATPETPTESQEQPTALPENVRRLMQAS